MSTSVRKTTPLGELIAAAFDRAALSSSDPQVVSRLAVISIAHLLGRAMKFSVSVSLPGA